MQFEHEDEYDHDAHDNTHAPAMPKRGATQGNNNMATNKAANPA
jgi:hypothetical protein